jgi:glycosyltransferase involved in cell wall biosynthesis
MLLSVIVPVYNAGAYLEPCLRSLLSVPVEKEIIVVDDGSSDGSIDALSDDIVRQISIVRQTNQGVSVARNIGLEHAHGSWIWFADADDVVSVSDGIDFAALADAKFVTLPFVWEEDGRRTCYAAHDGEVPYNLWRCWFRRDEIERYAIRFTVGRRYGEDQEFILGYLLATGATTRALATPTYHYTMRASGVMRRPGTRWRQRRDVTAVLLGFMANAIGRRKIAQKWVLREIKRLIKTILTI